MGLPTPNLRKRIATMATSLVVVVPLAMALLSVPAAAASSGPGWELAAQSLPTSLPPGGSGVVEIKLFNVGAAPSSGTVTVTDTLPPGVTATDAGELEYAAFGPGGELGVRVIHSFWSCNGTTTVTCTLESSGGFPIAAGGAGGGGPMLLGIAVNIAPGTSGTVANRVTVAGGGAPSTASTADQITISPTPAGFGVAAWDAWFSNADGTIDTQAGSHPYAATFNFGLNDAPRVANGRLKNTGGDVRNIEVALPPGIVGDPTAVPQCTRSEFDGGQGGAAKCPADSQIGIVTTAYAGGTFLDREPVYNMVPPLGVPAEFAFTIIGVNGILDAGVRTGGDYGITEHLNNAPQRGVVGSVVTLWGVPSDPSHNAWRNANIEGCTRECPSSSAAPKPFLTLPTACAGPQRFSVHVNTWQDASVTDQASFLSHDGNGVPTGFTGCEHLGFGPAITVAPDTAKADTPAGLTVEVKPPVGGLSDPGGLGTADIQNTTVALPEGLVINPGQAAGLAACQSYQDGVGTEEPPSCPAASKVGTVQITTPLLKDKLEGNVYVLQSNPPELKLLVAAAADGVNLKLVGTVHLNEQTGRLTTTFSGTPELPFTDFKLSFSGGAQAALDTPTQCGSYETTSDFTPWSSPFVADVFPTASFAIESGPSGGPCPSSPLPFSPSMIAGSTTDQAGAFTSFSLLLQRGDAQQRIEKLQFKEPAGLAGLISSVPLCQEPQAAQGSCSSASHIGHAVVTSGPGPYPLVLPQPGAPELPIYLTGPYKGAPFGLSIVTPVIAGPFNLGTIITRAKIEIDPTTAQITVTTDPFPQVVAGVPTDLRSIDSVIDRPGFLFNPTNCSPQEFAGTAWGTPPPGAGGPGATAAISSHFGVGSCRELAFAPKFTVSTSAHPSKAKGASLTARLAEPPGAMGSQANISKVKVELPIQLPSQLKTLQKACIDRVFNANPASCPPESIVGQATVHTQLLPVPLTGPAYFVSHGGEDFPSLTMVLQGYGVKIELVGSTLIRKGITSTTFKTVPDVPFETFELTLPQGKYAALAANLPAKAKGSFCGQKLVMPTEMIAQNGLQLHQNTPITVTGCPKAKTRAQLYAAALTACHKQHNHSKRQSCERQARRRYGPVKKKK
jgi:hypothetical protein